MKNWIITEDLSKLPTGQRNYGYCYAVKIPVIQGVCWAKDRQKWRAYITVDGRVIHLGQYEKKENAIEARVKAEKKYWS